MDIPVRQHYNCLIVAFETHSQTLLSSSCLQVSLLYQICWGSYNVPTWDPATGPLQLLDPSFPAARLPNQQMFQFSYRIRKNCRLHIRQFHLK